MLADTIDLIKKALFTIFILCMVTGTYSQSTVIRLYAGKAPGSEHWKQQEKTKFAPSWGERFTYNVTDPTLTVFEPKPGSSNGTAVIICPGGAFHILSIDNEGEHVAKWLNTIGVTAFVLRYRLAESKTDDPLKEIGDKMSNFKTLDEENAPVVPLAISDAQVAIRYVREHAGEWKIKPERIGIMGFSAGGTITAGAAFNYTPETRPNFAAPIYAYMAALNNTTVPSDAPPLFVAAATDDQLGFASHSTLLYNKWITAGKPAEIHVFAKGGHGFGMKKQNLPVDQWIFLFRDWLKDLGLL